MQELIDRKKVLEAIDEIAMPYHSYCECREKILGIPREVPSIDCLSPEELKLITHFRVKVAEKFDKDLVKSMWGEQDGK